VFDRHARIGCCNDVVLGRTMVNNKQFSLSKEEIFRNQRIRRNATLELSILTLIAGPTAVNLLDLVRPYVVREQRGRP